MNLRAFDKLAKTLAELDTLPRRLSVAIAPVITRELQKQFAKGTDPYGRKWRRLATGKASHLTESGRLRSGTRAAPLPGNRAGVRILFGSRARVAGFHQSGTANMPSRKILPERGMPAAWRTAIMREVRRLEQQARRAT